MFKYTHDQKLSAIRMLNEVGPARTKEMTGIPATTLYRWKKLIGENMNEAVDLEEAAPEEELPVCVEAVVEELPALEAPERESEMNAVNEKLVQSLLAENERLTLTNEHLRRENDQFRRTLLVLLER